MHRNIAIRSKTHAGSGTIFENQRGIALLMVLWVLTILIVIVFSFSYMARTEAYATLTFRQTIEKKFLAEAGIERGIVELFFWNQNKNATTVLEGNEVWRTDGRHYKILTEGGYYTIGIMNEGGKVDINTAPELLLKTLFINFGADQALADSITDSIMDWKDPDNLHRLHGAEDDYYMSLPNHYKARNANFETLEELLLVKGMTPEILYGSKEKRGIINFLTINSEMTTININSAPKEVLLAIPGITPELAAALLAIRESQDIGNIGDIPGVVGNTYLSTAQANAYTIESVGYKGAESNGYPIRATVTLEGNNKFKYRYYKNPSYSTQ